jgi:hypothetical protein
MTMQDPPYGEGTTGTPVIDSGTGYAQDGDRLQQAAGNVTERAKSTTETVLDSRREQVAGTVQQFAGALRQTSGTLREQDQAPIAEWVDTAAEKVEQASTFLRDRPVSDIVSEAEQFARRQPLVFLAGGLLLGLAASRFIKSSQQGGGMSGGQWSGGQYGSLYGRDLGTSGYGSTTYRSGGYSDQTTGYGQARSGYGTAVTDDMGTTGTVGTGSPRMTGLGDADAGT